MPISRKNRACISLISAVLAQMALIALVANPLLAATEALVYKVSADDVVNVNVARHPEFSGEFYIPADGNVSLPAAGQVQMSGKTLAQIAQDVQNKLRVRLKSPEVTVSLRTPSRKQVYVVGAVNRPGQYEMKPDWRCSELLAAGGGLLQDAAPSECKAALCKSSSEKTLTIDLASLVQGKPEANPVVESGDTLSIEAPEMINVYVSGRVRNPGMYKMRKDTASVTGALALAGGEQDNSAIDRVTITHASGATETCSITESVKNGIPAAGPKLQPMDVILVPEQTARIAVMGFVNSPGFIPVSSIQKTTLMDALSLAKGADARANIGAIALIRTENGKQTRAIYSLKDYLKVDDPNQNPELRPGDVVYVPQQSRTSLNDILGSAATLAWAINPFVK